eukprot:1642346-Rhodomonas_salina.1
MDRAGNFKCLDPTAALDSEKAVTGAERNEELQAAVVVSQADSDGTRETIRHRKSECRQPSMEKQGCTSWLRGRTFSSN